MTVAVKRVYDEPSPDDGTRVLVDRLWPRGLKKEAAQVDVWLKEIAPSTELRKRYHADGDWDAFKRDYLAELKANGEAAKHLREIVGAGKTTLLYSVRDRERNHALLIRERLR